MDQSLQSPPPSPEPAHNPVAFLQKGVKGIIIELFHRFNADQCAVWAAALSYFALLSLVPLLVGGLAVVGMLIHDPQNAAQQVQGLLAKLLPLSHPQEVARKLIVSAGIEQQAERLRQASGWAGIISIISFLFTASRIFVNAIAPMNAAFRAEETRNLFRLNLVAIGLLIGTSFLFLLSLVPVTAVHLLHSLPVIERLPDPPTWWLTALFFVLGIAINAVIFTVIYRFLPSPKARVTWKMAMVGGIFVAIIFEVAKEGFTLYLRNLNGGNVYDKAYGSLGVVAILFLWIHASSQLLLLGAELARLYADIQSGRHTKSADSRQQDQTTGTTAQQRKAQAGYIREGSSGWVSAKHISYRGRFTETVLGTICLVALLLLSFFVRRSSSGSPSSSP